MYFDLRLWQLMRGVRARLALAVLLGLTALAAGLARFAFFGQLLALVFQGRTFRVDAILAAAAAGTIVLRALLEEARVRLANAASVRVQELLRARLFDRIATLGPPWFSTRRSGGVMLSLIDGIEQIQTRFGHYLPQLAISIAAPFAIFAFAAHWDLPVAAVLLGGALTALISPMTVHMRERRPNLARAATLKSFGEEFLDAVQGLPTLKAFGQSRAFAAHLAARACALADNTFRVLAASLLTRAITDLGTAVGAAAVVSLAAWRVTQGEMSLAALLIVLMAGTEILRPLRDLRTVLHSGLLGQSAAAPILVLLEAEPAFPPSSHGSVRGLSPTLTFSAVRFAYPALRGLALDGLSFTAATGEHVSIVGLSGGRVRHSHRASDASRRLCAPCRAAARYRPAARRCGLISDSLWRTNMPEQLALIVGASRGLGRGLVQEYLARNWNVIATVRARHQLIPAPRLEIEHLDITDVPAIAALRARLAGRALDLLFVNAGVGNGLAERLAAASPEEFCSVMLANAYGPLRVIDACADLLAPEGVVAGMSSALGSVANNTSGTWEIYRASKAALNTLLRSFVARHPTHTVLALAPGWVRTDMGGPNATLSVEESVRDLAEVIAARRGTPGAAFLNYKGETIPW